ncbi:hypothetical protein DQ384_10200 [Sphaerisporangium album]|uniref:Uncharacterized protein n=1 Tax=Sphaerisporangium album TaxID=509200 RepID=A0A367FN62_9ACTN|nr:hypothetical protein [Sphaerisporangium album]RCG31120.1 hypothetical protein DQ384_10200 [Sphaerisporangium album]
MADTDPTCELHIRMTGQAHDQMLRLHGDQPSEDDLASWMQDGAVVRLLVSETANRPPHTILVNFGSVVLAWLGPFKSDRGVGF